MRKVRELLRLKWGLGVSHRQAARGLGISPSTVVEYERRARQAGLCWPLPEGLDDAQLEALLFPPTAPAHVARPLPNWGNVHQELRRKGVTLQLLWLEYKGRHPGGYQYSQFCELYRRWEKKLDVVLRQSYRAGEKAFVDYAGPTIPVVDAETGEVCEAQLFVGVLGASNYTYAEATWTQTLPDWIGSHVRMFEYWGGAPEVLVPDNLKAGVHKACYYEPDLNPTYHELAAHYGTTVIPARPYHPRDRAKVEAGVQVAERWIVAPLRHHTFFSLGELNHEIIRLREELNERPFQKLEGSRRSLFESLERPALKSLPPAPYEYAEWKKARVNSDYHIQVDFHFYSVPYRLVREQIDVRLTAATLEALYKGRRVAAHPRSRKKGGYTTDPAHMPSAHRKHLEWSPSRLLRWASRVGPATAELVRRILESRPHPEQGYRSCLGLMRLAKSYSPERLEAASRRALPLGALSYRSVKSILQSGLDRLPLEQQTTLALPREHANLRGPEYYRHNGKGD
jgi:transposase